MDERLRICLWMVGGGGFGSVLGGVFGATAAAFYAQSGGRAGTGLARRVLEKFLHLGERQPTSLLYAALLGAVDGFCFLGGLGLFTGALLGVSGRPADELLVPALVGSVVMVGGAIFFGTLAYALTRRPRTAALLSGFVGCVLGSVVTARGGSGYGAAGCVLGYFVGVFFFHAVRLYSPIFHPPRVGKTMPQSRSDSDTDITGSPHFRPGSAASRKPNADV
jgi:hypothetical protein